MGKHNFPLNLCGLCWQSETLFPTLATWNLIKYLWCLNNNKNSKYVFVWLYIKAKWSLRIHSTILFSRYFVFKTQTVATTILEQKKKNDSRLKFIFLVYYFIWFSEIIQSHLLSAYCVPTILKTDKTCPHKNYILVRENILWMNEEINHSISII